MFQRLRQANLCLALHKRYEDELIHDMTIQNPEKMTATIYKLDPCKKPMKDLQRISIEDSRMDERAGGGYLLLRTIEPFRIRIGIESVVEDHEGNTIFFLAYHFTDDLPIGTVFILKEPFLKVSKSGDPMLYCNCPTDIIVLYEGHELFGLTDGAVWQSPGSDPGDEKPVTALEWKNKGNLLFKEKKYERATCCYSMALQKAQELEDDQGLVNIARLNLSAAFLLQGRFEQALKFAETVLQSDSKNPKALLRAGKSSYHLGKYKEAEQYFGKYHRLFPGKRDGKEELERCKKRILEQETGALDEKYAKRDFKSGEVLDCANYVGPIKMVPMPGKGRGMIATRDIEPGTLLLVSKAVAGHFVLDQQNQVEQILCTEDGMLAYYGIFIKLITQIAQMMAKNPNMTVDYIFFGPAESGQWFCDPETKLEPFVDMERVRQFVLSHYFGINDFNCPRQIDKMDCFYFGGVHTLLAYFNRQCIPNASFNDFNNIMVVRAIQTIKCGGEIFIAYWPWKLGRLFRQMINNFECLCRICSQDKREPVEIHLKRDAIFAEFRRLCSHDIMEVGQYEKLIADCEDTYGISSLKIEMTQMYFRLAFLYRSRSEYKEELACYFKILELFGFQHDSLIYAFENSLPLIPPNALLDEQVLLAVKKICMCYPNVIQGDNGKWLYVLTVLEKIYFGHHEDVDEHQVMDSLFIEHNISCEFNIV